MSLLEADQMNDGAPAPEVAAKAIQGRSLWAIAWRRLKANKVAMVAGAIIVLMVLVAVFANVITKIYGHSPSAGDINLLDPNTNLPKGDFGGISADHWFGVTPSLGQDLFSRIMFGARTSLLISVSATALALLLGITLGIAAGYYRGWVDQVVSRVMDVLLSFPTLLFSISLIMVVSIVFKGSSQVGRYLILIFVLGFFGFPYIGRIVRGQVLSLREKEFVEAARSLGAKDFRIMFKEIFPNLIGPILVYTTLTIPNNMIGEASLSYLGIGIQSPAVSWGGMLSDAGNYFQTDPMYLLFPGLALFISVLAFNLFGDGLRDALDPKSTQ